MTANGNSLENFRVMFSLHTNLHISFYNFNKIVLFVFTVLNSAKTVIIENSVFMSNKYTLKKVYLHCFNRFQILVRLYTMNINPTSALALSFFLAVM